MRWPIVPQGPTKIWAWFFAANHIDDATDLASRDELAEVCYVV